MKNPKSPSSKAPKALLPWAQLQDGRQPKTEAPAVEQPAVSERAAAEVLEPVDYARSMDRAHRMGSQPVVVHLIETTKDLDANIKETLEDKQREVQQQILDLLDGKHPKRTHEAIYAALNDLIDTKGLVFTECNQVFAAQRDPLDMLYLNAARNAPHLSEGDLEVDPAAIVERASDDFAKVTAWLWVPASEVTLPKGYRPKTESEPPATEVQPTEELKGLIAEGLTFRDAMKAFAAHQDELDRGFVFASNANAYNRDRGVTAHVDSIVSRSNDTEGAYVMVFMDVPGPVLTWPDLDPFERAYVECALWSSNDESTPSGGEPFDRNHGVEDFSELALAQAVADCTRFRQMAGPLLKDMEPGRAGHCLWLNRNGHGSGFWDENTIPKATGEKLSALCDQLGETSPYLGDNGKIYFE